MFSVMGEPLLYIFGDANANVMKNFLWIKDLSAPDPLLYGLPLINADTQYIYLDLSKSFLIVNSFKKVNICK